MRWGCYGAERSIGPAMLRHPVGAALRGLVDADGGGFRPRAGAFGSDGADPHGEPGADGAVFQEEAGGAHGDDGEGVPGDVLSGLLPLRLSHALTS